MKEPVSPLPWKIDEAKDLPLGIIEDNEMGLSVIEDDIGHPDQVKNFQYIVQACNNFPKAVQLLEEAKIQIEYLHGKFQETGTGNQVLSQLNTFLDEIQRDR